jgi:hypothetical protein
MQESHRRSIDILIKDAVRIRTFVLSNPYDTGNEREHADQFNQHDP